MKTAQFATRQDPDDLRRWKNYLEKSVIRSQGMLVRVAINEFMRRHPPYKGVKK